MTISTEIDLGNNYVFRKGYGRFPFVSVGIEEGKTRILPLLGLTFKFRSVKVVL
jgi:hypothetical protein